MKKANFMVGLIWRSLSYVDGSFFKKRFTALLRPHLEYGQVVIWTLYLKTNISTFENVQCCATKLVDGKKFLNYTE